MIVALIAALLVGFVLGAIAAPQAELAYWRVKRDVLAWRARRRRPDPPAVRRMLAATPQEGPPTRRCRYVDAKRGRCLNDRDHLGDHLLPADLGL